MLWVLFGISTSRMEKSTFTAEYSLFLQLLREERVRSGLTQKNIADRLEQTQSWISKCERGERRLDFVEVRAFCEALGISFSDFTSTFDKLVKSRTDNHEQTNE